MWIDRNLPRQGAPEEPYGYIQWKNTDVCVDFQCLCGEYGHFDGYFADILKCPTCERLWQMPDYLIPRPYVSDGTIIGVLGKQQAKVINIE